MMIMSPQQPAILLTVGCFLLLLLLSSTSNSRTEAFLTPKQQQVPQNTVTLTLTRQIPSTTIKKPTVSCSSCLFMIGNFLGNNNLPATTTTAAAAPKLPRDVKDAVSQCRAAVQQALQNKCSRMDIEMPVGAKFGVEQQKGTTNNNQMQQRRRLAAATSGSDADGTTATTTPTREMVEQSNRELARLFVEMFQPVGGDNIAVVFQTAGLADNAKQIWKGVDYSTAAACRILAIDRKNKRGDTTSTAAGSGGSSKSGNNKKSQNKRGGKAMGFAAKLAAEMEDDGPGSPFDLPGNIEVALFVAPGPKELVQVERICNKVGMGTLVILLNARLSSITNNFGSPAAKKLFLQDFEPVFALCAAPQQEAPGCLLYRSYPGPWVVARKPKVGPPKPILITQNKEKPTKEQCQKAYDDLELDNVEKGIENVLENVAGWFN